jgi:hypothetical protein
VQGYFFCKPLKIADLERWNADWVLSSRNIGAGVASA